MENKFNKKAALDSTAYYYSKEVDRIPLLTPQEEQELARKIMAGNKEAFNKLVQSNLRFVYKIAARYKGQGLEMEDLIEEGNIGLMTAASKYKPTMNARFVTYASYWIRATIQSAICEKGSPIRFPANWYKAMKNDCWKVVSLDKVVNEESQTTLADLLEDEKDQDPLGCLIQNSTARELSYALNGLSDLQYQVITLRYGLFGQKPLSLRQAGQKLGYSRERIRQIEARSLGIMKDRLEDMGFTAELFAA